MKKWLAALILCLLMVPAALADDMFPALCGMWLWDEDSPAAPLGDGVYFRVDGSCVLYDAPDNDHADPSAPMSVCAEGTWTVLGDTLLIAAGDAVYSLPVRLIAARDPECIDGVQIGEGAYRNFSWRNPEAPPESAIPEAVAEEMRAWHPSAVIEDYKELPDVGGVPMGFLLIRSDEGRQLRTYRFTEDGWHGDDVYTAGIPQGILPEAWLSVSRGGEEALPIWYDQREHDYDFPDGPRVGIWTSNGETHEERVEYAWVDNAASSGRGDFLLVHYGDSPARQVDVFGNELVFYNIGSGYEGYRYHHLDRQVAGVDFYALPRSLSEGRAMGGAEPDIPVCDRVEMMSRQSFLTPQDVTLREDRTYPVYIGPGREYGRAANGRATVSTNGWVQVFGEYEGWLLIHYAISAEQYRFGWITADALAKGERAEPVPFVFGDIVSGNQDLPLTDDPLNSRTPLLTLSLWADIEYLAQLGEDFSYVRVEVDSRMWWGFVYTWPLGHG